MLPLNHKRTTSSLVPPIFYVAKKFCNKKIEGSPLRWIFCTFSYHATAPLEEACKLARQKIPSAAALQLYSFTFDDFGLKDCETLQVRLEHESTWAEKQQKATLLNTSFKQHLQKILYIHVDGNIRNPALPVMPRHYWQKDEISFIKKLLG